MEEHEEKMARRKQSGKRDEQPDLGMGRGLVLCTFKSGRRMPNFS